MTNLDVSLELSQISGFGRRRWLQRLAWLTALGAVAAGGWASFSCEHRVVSHYRRASMDLSPVAVSESSIARAIVFERTVFELPVTADAAVHGERVRDSGTLVDSRIFDQE